MYKMSIMAILFNYYFYYKQYYLFIGFIMELLTNCAITCRNSFTSYRFFDVTAYYCGKYSSYVF